MKYCKEKTEEICKHLEVGASQKDAATLSDISEETFYQWMAKPEFAEQIKKAQQKCKQRNIQIIQKAAIKTWTAAAWWLERRHSDEFALKNRFEHTGREGGPIQSQVVPPDLSKLTTEQLAQLAAMAVPENGK